MNKFQPVFLGISRHPAKFVRNIFLSYSVIWTLCSPISALFPIFNAHGIWKFMAIIVTSLIISIFISAEPKQITMRIKNTNTTVKIIFGDLFKQTGQKVISVNEYFDSDIGDHVSPNSLHGKFIVDILGGQSQSFNKLVHNALKGVSFEEIPRKQGQRKRYRIGTTAAVNTLKDKYYLVALCRTDTTTLKAKAEVVDLWNALEGLWSAVRINHGGNPVNLPLIGSGLSGVGLPPNQLLKVIIISILNETKKNEIANNIRIVVPIERFEELDLHYMKKELG